MLGHTIAATICGSQLGTIAEPCLLSNCEGIDMAARSSMFRARSVRVLLEGAFGVAGRPAALEATELCTCKGPAETVHRSALNLASASLEDIAKEGSS